MADTQTSNILLTNQQDGGNNNTWGTIADNNFEQIDDKFGDTTIIDSTGGTTSLTDEQEIVLAIDVQGTLVTNKIIEFSGRGGSWIIRNNTTGDFTLTCKVNGETGVEIPQGTKKTVWCDGEDIDSADTDEEAASEVTVASASTCNILGAGSEFVAVSGTATITSFGSAPDAKRFVRATGAFKITHNAASLICPGGQDITAAAGDTFIVISNASGNARIWSYQRAVQPPPGLAVGVSFDFWGTTAPAYHLLMYGQDVSRVTYKALFDVIGTAHGVGDGVNTFGIPDCRGRVVVGKDNMGGTSANRLTGLSGGINADNLGETGGTESNILLRSNLPNDTVTVTSDGNHVHTYVRFDNDSSSGFQGGSTGGFTETVTSTSTGGAHTHNFALNGGVTQTAVNNVQPSIVANKIIYCGAV
jgi:microcystin-dependent protein